MASLHLNNFLWGARQIAMGGGVGPDGVTAKLDGGYLHDVNIGLGGIIFPTEAESGTGTDSPLLGAAAAYGVAAGAGITNTGPTVIEGNVSVGPGTPTITGFPPGVITGTTDTSGTAQQAAITAAVVTINAGVFNAFPGSATDLAGQTLTPGNWTGGAVTISNSGVLTLNGAGVYKIKATTSFVIGTAVTIVLINGATAANVYFTSASSITVNTTSSLFGNFIAASTMTFANGATLVGRAFAQTASVTFINNLVTVPGAGVQSSIVASETNLRVLSAAAGSTTIGYVSFPIPRDYDEATDTFQLKLGIASAGATNAPAITAAAYRKRPGSSIATLSASVTGKTEAGGTFTMTSAEQVMIINLSRFGLRRDDTVTIALTAAAHATDAVLIYFVEVVYRSTLVSYHESNVNPNTTTTRDGKTGVFLR